MNVITDLNINYALEIVKITEIIYLFFKLIVLCMYKNI